MNTSLQSKLQILAESAKYDASCSSSGSSRSGAGSLGMASTGGVCHSWSADGRCISLLKILMTNVCIYDCEYCVNRCSNDIPRARFTPGEIADLTINFYRKNYIEGLFLSSGVIQSPDHTMELLNRSIKLLRTEHRFSGYIHLKLIPGASDELIAEAGRWADRVSVNIELPTRQSLALLAPHKNIDSILHPMRTIRDELVEHAAQKKKARAKQYYAPAGQSTQLIVGATPETDWHIMKLSSWLYNNVELKRVYYSAYVPVNNAANLPALAGPPLLREHRLYQADWLLRFYDFEADELLSPDQPLLDTEVDPKTSWALRHLDRFPIEINTADYNDLLRIPGIGIRTAQRIIRMRRVKRVRYEDLKKLRTALKRAQYFITINGKYYGDLSPDSTHLKSRIITPQGKRNGSYQMELFDSRLLSPAETGTAITGEF